MLFMVIRSLLIVAIIMYASTGQANETIPVLLTAKDSGSSVELRQGQVLNISLYGNGTTGFSWYVESVSESILRQGETRCDRSACQPGMAGCGATCTYTFTAVAPGQGPLKLIYHRIWEQGVPPLQTFEITVSVDKGVPVPALSEWGAIIFTVTAGLGAALALHKKKIGI